MGIPRAGIELMNSIESYHTDQTYLWNYEHGPPIEPVNAATAIGRYNFCGLKVGSPLGVAAGPLLHGGWICYYAQRGFDLLTYKTVRSKPRECYVMPNLQPVDPSGLNEGSVTSMEEMRGSWAVSFGMPSQHPNVWQADIARTRAALPSSKVLSVSVVATAESGWSILQVADDYADCARMAVDAGADAVELNFSCPNVTTCDGQLYQSPRDAGIVAEQVRARVGTKPLLLKIGHLTDQDQSLELLEAVTPFVDALVMVNGIAAQVTDEAGNPMFGGQSRGICGAVIRTRQFGRSSGLPTRFRRAICRPRLLVWVGL